MSELLKINVNEHTEKKNGLTYLSWAWAWAEVLKIDPDADWEAVEYVKYTDDPFKHPESIPCMILPDGSAMVKTRVTIKGKTKACLLPVMDHRNKAIKNPDAFAINTAIMRCMTKAISMHGLGLYIYAGEDLPESDEPTDEAQDSPRVGGGSPRKLVAEEAASRLTAERKDDLTEDALKIVTAYKSMQTDALMKVWDSITDNDERAFLWHLLAKESKVRAFIKAQSEERRKATA